jgi:hypothetical protein
MMLVAVANVLALGIFGEAPVNNALLESFVIHVRALMDFLYAPENAQADDVLAEDFFQSPELWTNLRPTLSELLSEAKRRAGKEIAHLTYARLHVTPETKPWHFVQIANELSAVINVFLQNVSRDKLGSQWQHPVEQPKTALKPGAEKLRDG